MKDAERRFFRYLIKQIDYENLGIYFSLTKNLEIFIDHYSETRHIPAKKLWYYINKWKTIGMADYSRDLHAGYTTTELQFIGLFNNNDKQVFNGDEVQPPTTMPKEYEDIIPKRVLRKIHSRFNEIQIEPACILNLNRAGCGYMIDDKNIGIYFEGIKEGKYICTYKELIESKIPECNGLHIIDSAYRIEECSLPSISDLCDFIEKNNFGTIPNSVMYHNEYNDVLVYCFDILNYRDILPSNLKYALGDTYIFDGCIYFGLMKVGDKLLITDIDDYCDKKSSIYPECISDTDINKFVHWFIFKSSSFEELTKDDIDTFYNDEYEEVLFNNGKIVIASSYDEASELERLNQCKEDATKYSINEEQEVVVGFKYKGKVIYYLYGTDKIADNYSFFAKYIAEELINQ